MVNYYYMIGTKEHVDSATLTGIIESTVSNSNKLVISPLSRVTRVKSVINFTVLDSRGCPLWDLYR